MEALNPCSREDSGCWTEGTRDLHSFRVADTGWEWYDVKVVDKNTDRQRGRLTLEELPSET